MSRFQPVAIGRKRPKAAAFWMEANGQNGNFLAVFIKESNFLPQFF
ncbi:hypothetical protein HBO12_15125 [Pseudomonas sp. WS 5059]|nr:hypothetical protein [Pseudomonas sp. WS 5059]NMY04294.1 hypothetical protein [Pseudomonas sp. WS 5059]